MASGKAKSKIEIRREALEQWWGRSWPVVVLGVDPGREAGASLIDSKPGSIRLVWSHEVDTATRQVEAVIEAAIDYAAEVNKPLVLAVEDWGAGGHRGLAQWIGLGEQRGAWLRAFGLHYHVTGRLKTKPKVVKIPQSRWRSRLCETHGSRNGEGTFRKHDSHAWKREAYTAANLLFLDAHVPVTENAAESACIGYFAARADVTGKLLSKRWLAQHGQQFEPVEPMIHPKAKRKGTT